MRTSTNSTAPDGIGAANLTGNVSGTIVLRINIFRTQARLVGTTWVRGSLTATANPVAFGNGLGLNRSGHVLKGFHCTVHDGQADSDSA